MECSRTVEKLGLDFFDGMARGRAMDEDLDDLIAQLCTQLGIIMEDASVVAIGVTRFRGEERRAAIIELEAAAAKIGVLSKALNALSS